MKNFHKPALILLALILISAASLTLYALTGGSLNIPYLGINAGGGQTHTGGTLSATLSVAQSVGSSGATGGSIGMTGGFTGGAVPTAASDLASAHAFPVPFRPSRGHTKITFTDLTPEADLLIYTISGELVKTINKKNATAAIDWDARNDKGEDLASGVYVFIIKSSGSTKKGKLMIIR